MWRQTHDNRLSFSHKNHPDVELRRWPEGDYECDAHTFDYSLISFFFLTFLCYYSMLMSWGETEINNGRTTARRIPQASHFKVTSLSRLSVNEAPNQGYPHTDCYWHSLTCSLPVATPAPVDSHLSFIASFQLLSMRNRVWNSRFIERICRRL